MSKFLKINLTIKRIKFSGTHKLPKLTHEEIDGLNNSIFINRIELVVKKTTVPDGLIGEFY